MFDSFLVLSVKIISLVFLGSMALSGCNTRSSSDHHYSMSVTKRSNEVNHYAYEVQSAINEALTDKDRYRGKACTVWLSLDQKAVLQSVRADGGDPAFCQEMILAVKRVNFPKFPSDETYVVFKTVPIDFKL